MGAKEIKKKAPVNPKYMGIGQEMTIIISIAEKLSGDATAPHLKNKKGDGIDESYREAKISDHIIPDCLCHSGRQGMDTELAVNTFYIILDGVNRNVQFGSRHFITVSINEESQHLAFAHG